MSVSPGRLLCPQCGVNNFDTQAACWKCGAPLKAGATTAPAHRPASPFAAPPPAARAADSAPPVSVDPTLANVAAFSLALLFPFVAVPAGLIFLMLDDRRKAQIGKLTLVWGILFSLLHFVFTGWLLREAVAQVKGLLPALPGQPQRQPQPDDPVEPIPFPGATP